jgi:DNA invertase Pin-like site-specific DNA recombinase
MSDLVELAERLIRATAEVETVREAMKRLLLNGGGGEGPKPNPPRAQRLGGQESQSQESQASKRKSLPHHPNAILGRAAEARILELLKQGPMKTAEIAQATATGKSTVVQRLTRMKAKGQIAGGGNEGYRAASAAPG